MRWPPWSTTVGKGEEQEDQRSIWTDTLNATNWSHYTDPRTVVPTLILTTTCLLSVRLYRSYFRRIPQVISIQPSFWRRRSLFGQVTSVGDGDNFRLFHTPGGRLAGWGWLPWRRVPSKKEDLRDKTVRSTFSGLSFKHLTIRRSTFALLVSMPQSWPILDALLNHIRKMHLTGLLHISSTDD